MKNIIHNILGFQRGIAPLAGVRGQSPRNNLSERRELLSLSTTARKIPRSIETARWRFEKHYKRIRLARQFTLSALYRGMQRLPRARLNITGNMIGKLSHKNRLSSSQNSCSRSRSRSALERISYSAACERLTVRCISIIPIVVPRSMILARLELL